MQILSTNSSPIAELGTVGSPTRASGLAFYKAFKVGVVKRCVGERRTVLSGEQ